MRRAVLALLVGLGSAASASVPVGGGDAEREALRTRATAELEALARQPESARRLGAESRLLHYLAEATRDDVAREELHARGLRAAERALAIDPDEPTALLWWTAHRGSQATPLRPWEAIRIAADVERTLLRLRALDPGFDHAAADRVLGHVYRVAPPVLSIGSLRKSEDHLRAALARAPAYPGNLLAFAQLLARQGRCEAARRGAEVVLASPVLPRYPLEAFGWRREARALAEACR